MQYGTRDLLSYGGFILGTAGSYQVLEMVGVEQHWVRLVVGICIGVAVGWAAVKLYGGKETSPKR